MKTLTRFSTVSLVTMATILGIGSQAQAGTLSLNASSFGTYNSSGTRNTTNYVTGRGATTETRSYFVFNLNGNNLNAAYRTILRSELRVANPTNGYSGPSGSSATFNVTNVGSSANLGINSSNNFNDLGTGTGTFNGALNRVYGSTSVSSNSNGQIVTVNLGSNANAAIVGQANSTFAVGGALTGFSTTQAQTLFNNAGTSTLKQLIIEYADAQADTNGNQQFGNVLIGESSTVNVIVTNIGDQGSSLTGTIGASGNSFITSSTLGLQSFTNLASGESASRSFTFTPTQRTGDQAATTVITINSNTRVPAVVNNPILTGSGVAPVNSITTFSTNAGYVRLGTSAELSMQVLNAGDGNTSGRGTISNLNGSFSLAGSSDFSGIGSPQTTLSLQDGRFQNVTSTYRPTDRGEDIAVVDFNFINGSSDGTNKADSSAVTLTGYGVGPEFVSSVAPGSTIDFSRVQIGQTGIFSLVITNDTVSPENADPALSQLTLLDALFEGSNAFSLLDFTPGQVLLAGESATFRVAFTPQSERDFQSVLRFLTDQGTDIGGDGEDFEFNLQGTGEAVPVVPEPNSAFGLVTLFGATVLFSKKKKVNRN